MYAVGCSIRGYEASFDGPVIALKIEGEYSPKIALRCPCAAD